MEESVHQSIRFGSGFFSLFHCSTTPLTCRSTDSSDFEICWTDAVADLIMWKNRRVGFLLLGSTTLLWFLFEKCGYSFFPFVVNTQLLLVVILFLWAKSAILFNRYLLYGTLSEECHILLPVLDKIMVALVVLKLNLKFTVVFLD